MYTWIKSTGVIAAGILALFATANAQQAESRATLPEHMRLEYKVKAPLGRGVSHRTLQRQGDRWHVAARFKLKGALGALQKGEQTEQSEFRIKNGAIQVLSYHSQRTGRKPYNRRVTVDYTARTVVIGEQKQPLPTDGTITEYASLPFYFMQSDPRDASLAGRKFYLTNGKNLRLYTAEAARTDEIKTIFGTIDALAITMHREGGEGRSFTMWLAPQQNNLMVQLSVQRKGRETVFKLATPPQRGDK